MTENKKEAQVVAYETLSPNWVKIVETQILKEQILLQPNNSDKTMNEPQVVIEQAHQTELIVEDIEKNGKGKEKGKKRKQMRSTQVAWKNEFKQRTTWVIVISEAVAQAFLTYMIVQVNRTATFYNTNKMATQIVVAVGHTLTFAISFIIFFPISKCQMNPAVTVALYAMGELTFLRSILTVFFQFIGGLVGAGLALWSEPKEVQQNAALSGANFPQTSFHQVFAAEFAGMWIFMMSILANVVDYRGMGYLYGAWQIGATLGYNIFLVGPSATGSLNPFRTLSIAILTSTYAYTWTFIIAQFLGALLAVAFYRNLFLDVEQMKNKEYQYKNQQYNKKVGQVVEYFKQGGVLPPGLTPIYTLKVTDWFRGSDNELDHAQPLQLNEQQLYIIEFFTGNLEKMSFTCRVLNKMLKEINGPDYSLEDAESKSLSLVVYGITYDKPKTITKYIQDYQPNYLIGRDEDGKGTLDFVQDLGMQYLPTCIVVRDCSVIWMGCAANPELQEVCRKSLQNEASNRVYNV